MLENEIRNFVNSQNARVAVVYKNLVSNIGFSINGDDKFPSASTIKLVVMATVLKQVKEGKHSLDDKVVITKEMLTGGDGILKEMNVGHSFTLKEILTFMIIVSDNMATNILIDLVGMESINQMAKEMNLKEAHLGRHMMDSQAKKLGNDNFICALDMASVLEKIYMKQFVDEKSSAIALEILKKQQQMGRLQLYLSEEVLVAHKCGDLDFLEHDGGIFLNVPNPYVLVVLTCDNESNKEGREIIGKISKMVYDRVTK